MDIIKKKELRLNNLLSCRKHVHEVEINREFINMATIIKRYKLNQTGSIITTVHSINEGDGVKIMDIEIMIPVDIENSIYKGGNLTSLEKNLTKINYRFIKSFILEDMLYTAHKGTPELLNASYEKMRNYIVENKLQSRTPIYNIYRNKIGSNQSVDDLIIDIFIGIQPAA